MEIHDNIVFQDVTEFAVLRKKLERAVGRVYSLEKLRGEKWSIVKSVKGDVTIVSVGPVYGPLEFNHRTEEFGVEYMTEQVRY